MSESALSVRTAELDETELASYGKLIDLAVGGDRAAIAEICASPVLDKLARFVAARIARASYWDRAVTAEDIVQMTVCEMLSDCTYLSVNELRRRLYTATRNNVIDIHRRQRVIRFEPLGTAGAETPAADSLQAEVERDDLLCKWQQQVNSWFVSLNPVDQFILKSSFNGTQPRAIARSLYDGDWTKLSKDEQQEESSKISRRLYKLRDKLTQWAKKTRLTGSIP